LVLASGKKEGLSVTALYSFVCQSHTAVPLLRKLACSMQDSATTIGVAIKCCVIWDENEGSGNSQKFSQ
jgi:hypothetical protein